MSKVKSAVITTLFVIAIVVLALFSTVSWPVAGTDGTDTLNSFVGNIHLGSDFTGSAYVMLYPEGVISAADYDIVVKDSANADKDKYEKKYSSRGGVYVANEKLEDEEGFKASIKKDADILNGRCGRKEYSSYSVALEDGGFAIKVTVPTNYTYVDYKNEGSLTEISNTVSYLMLNGELTIRNSSTYEGSKSVLPSVNDKAADCFKDINLYSMAGNYFVRMIFTKEGLEKIKPSVTEEASAYLFVGETYLTGFDLTNDALGNITNNTLTLNAGKSAAQDYSILLNTVINGKTLTNSYNSAAENSATSIVAVTPAFGEHAPIYLFVTLLLVLAVAVALPFIKYKKLGYVCAMVTLIYALSLVCAVMLIEIQITVAGALTAVLGLGLLLFTNFYVFEAIRKESLLGRTMQASIKAGYKRTLWTVLDLHLVMLAISLLLALVCVGEAAACGFIFFIATIASYVLYWFTRFMWYVLSSPVKDKFKFCGIKREAYDED